MEIFITHIHYSGINAEAWPGYQPVSHAEGSKMLESPSWGRDDDGLMFSVCPWPARSWRGPAVDTPSATRPPGWCNGAESISTRLLEPPSAVIVITHPGPVSQPTIYAICTQMWNYEAASHKRDRLSWLHRFLHHRDYDDGFTHQRIVSENWRWFPEKTKWPLTVLGSLNCLFPDLSSSSLDVPPATNTHSNLHHLQCNFTVEIYLYIVHIVNAHRTI